ncbi:MAG: NAD(P)-dependent oxidoreductase [Candidatus Rokubacteria bacterium]|nr:NAD(P)-dependent oxidoreductase [Candidatus Rokubacteria bacterium]
MTTIAVLHPGEMGSGIGASVRAAGARVIWASDGRGAATRTRAEADGLEDVRTLAEVVRQAEVILSVCPPASAQDVARQVAALKFRGTYVDGNAIAPATTKQVGEIVTAGGATFVDGGIIGPPPRQPGLTRLYLSGAGAAELAKRLNGGLMEAIALDGPVGAASAIKMAYAGWNKTQMALLMAVRAYAMKEGVEDALLREWGISQKELPKRSEQAVAGTARKAWRFVGEMEELAAAFAAAGVPGDFHDAGAEVYRRMAAWKDAPTPPSVAEVMKALASPR